MGHTSQGTQPYTHYVQTLLTVIRWAAKGGGNLSPASQHQEAEGCHSSLLHQEAGPSYTRRDFGSQAQ